MGNNKVDALLDFFLFSDLEDEVAVDSYIEEEGLDFNSFYENMGMLIRKKKAEQKLAKGKKFREQYLLKAKQILKEALEDGYKIEESALAFRNLEDLNEDDMANILADKKKLDILKKMLEDNEN